MKHIKTIAVGIDFSAGSKAALREALRIGQWSRASVRAIHVIDSMVATELAEALQDFQRDVPASLVADAREAWGSFSAEIAGADAVELEVRIDHRVQGIVDASTAMQSDLLVLGVHGTRTPEVGMGTVATSCVRHAKGDVLLVRDTQSRPFKVVLACIDFSPTSLRALDFAAQVAEHDGASLHVLHVFNGPWHRLHYRAPTPEADPHFQQQYREGLERRLRAFTGGIGRDLARLQPAYRVVDDTGHRPGIIDEAAKVGADLIVLGTRGRSNVRDLLLGSTAEKVLRESACSVLAVRAAAPK